MKLNIDTTYVETPSGLKLSVRLFQAVAESTSRTVIITHGLSEHSGRYEHVGMYFANRGWNVIIPDLRGHGHSEGASMHVDHFDQFCDDLQAVREHFDLDPSQLVMLGHSLGGLIAARDAQLYPQSCSQLVLMSPFLGMIRKPPVWKWYAAKLVSMVAPETLFATEINPDEATTNPVSVAQRQYDPLTNDNISAGLFFECQRALVDVWVDLNKIEVPVLLFQAEDDFLVDAEASLRWLAQLKLVSNSPCEAHRFPEHRHELFNEADWEETCDRVINWMELNRDAERIFPNAELSSDKE